MTQILQYIQNNKEWLFSGLGITFLSSLGWMFQRSLNNFRKIKLNYSSNQVSGEIKVIGTRASGKTVYLASLVDWYNLEEKSPIYSIKALNNCTKKLINIAEDTLKRGHEFPPSFLPDNPYYMPEYSLNIQVLFNPYFWPKYFLLNKHISMNISFKDYPGETFDNLAFGRLCK